MATKHYIVTLLLRLGCYEKHSQQLVSANTKEDAELIALRDETHNDADREDTTGEWWDDDMLYEVDYTREVPDDDFEILKKYHNYY